MNTARKELLQENRRALRFLHDVQGFDFEKEHIMLSLPGKFTYNTVHKAVCQHIPSGDLSTDYTVAVLAKPTGDYIFPNKLYYIRSRGGKFDADRLTGADYYNYSVDYHFSVGSFDDFRKNYTKRVFIIAQRKDLMQQPKGPKPFNLSARYLHISGKADRLASDGKGHRWISGIVLRHTDGSAAITEYKPFDRVQYRCEDRTDDLRAIIDKSGYIVLTRRAELKRRADALLAERKRAEAAATDFTEENARISRLVCDCKLLISDAIMRAKTADDVRKAERAANDLWHLIERFESHKKRVQNREYPSIQDARYRLDLMSENAANVKARLQ